MDKAAEVMARMAEQLGVAAGDLWPAMVWREQVLGAVMVVAGIALLSACAWAARLAVRRWEDICNNDLEPFALIAATLGTVAVCAALILLAEGAVALLAPEAAAVKALFGACR